MDLSDKTGIGSHTVGAFFDHLHGLQAVQHNNEINAYFQDLVAKCEGWISYARDLEEINKRKDQSITAKDKMIQQAREENLALIKELAERTQKAAGYQNVREYCSFLEGEIKSFGKMIKRRSAETAAVQALLQAVEKELHEVSDPKLFKTLDLETRKAIMKKAQEDFANSGALTFDSIATPSVEETIRNTLSNRF